MRIGGLVEAGSVQKDGQEVRFTVTDTNKTVDVVYRGLLPDLFREGQGVVAEGTLGADGVFIAREVLAKHDEKYMPPEVAKALKESGRWQEGNEATRHCDGGRQRLQRSEAQSPLVELQAVYTIFSSEPRGLSALRFAAAPAARRDLLIRSLQAP